MITELDNGVFEQSFRRHVFVSEDGCEIACWSNGNTGAPALILLHGFALDHTIWAGVCADPELLRWCHLVVPDLRGHGESGHGKRAEAYTDGAAWAADVHAVITGLSLMAPTLVAWSFGGRSALDYVRRYSTAAISGIVFVAAAAQAHYESVGPDHDVLAALWSDQPDAVDAATTHFVTKVLEIAPGSQAEQAIRASVARSTPAERGWMRQRPLDYDALIDGLDLPVMWINGMRDQIVLASRTQAFCRAQPSARVSLYEGGGHAPFLAFPDRFARDLLGFLVDPPLSSRQTATA